jgi:predicted house-cleaning noncanonical NTP pyrophosphatase (MazG superfamily)
VIRYDKLVRDRIPEIIETNGERCTVRTLTDEEYAQRLDEKLAEELAEYRENGDVEELVDLIELVRAIVAQQGMSWDEFERMREHKATERGGFRNRLLLEAVFTPKEKGRDVLDFRAPTHVCSSVPKWEDF